MLLFDSAFFYISSLYDDSDFESEPIESLLPAQRVMFGQSSENQNAEAETANDKDVVDEWKP